MTTRIIIADVIDGLRSLEAESVQCCVTSPPYWGLRDYGMDGQLGLEATPEEYVARMVEVFREVRRVLREDGTCWVNLGDSYNAYNANRGESPGFSDGAAGRDHPTHGRGLTCSALKPKDLVGIPWRVAFALQADGWYLRSDIIWHKPNPMPESVTDRPTKAHEYVFLLTKGTRYFYDADAIREAPTSRPQRRLTSQKEHAKGKREVCPYCDGGGVAHDPGEGSGPVCPECNGSGSSVSVASSRPEYRDDMKTAPGVLCNPLGRNARSVWTIPTRPYSAAHFATMPEALAEPCVKAGSRKGDTVLDPFGGSGTTGLVADKLKRSAILIELNPEYAEIARERIVGDSPMFADVTVDRPPPTV